MHYFLPQNNTHYKKQVLPRTHTNTSSTVELCIRMQSKSQQAKESNAGKAKQNKAK